MPVVHCPHCSKPASLPDTWSGSAYTCPHCRNAVVTASPSAGSKKPAPALDFSTDDEDEGDYQPPQRRATRRASYGASAGPSWLHTFSAVFVGALLAGIVLLVGIRFYVYWSIQDTLEKIKNPPAAGTK